MKNQRNAKTVVSRRSFVKSFLYAATGVGLLSTGLSDIAAARIWSYGQARLSDMAGSTSNKRDLVLSVLDTSTANKYVPAAFFMHFGENYKQGQAAIDRHLEYFKATDMDFVKVQYELGMPRIELTKPADWKNAPSNFILGADCTMPNTTHWETLRSIIQQAHTYRN